jgi:hypothetical protein
MYGKVSCKNVIIAPLVTDLKRTEAGFLVRVYPDPCLILIRAQIRALLCASKSKFIPAETSTLLVLDKKNGLRAGSYKRYHLKLCFFKENLLQFLV